MAEKSEAPSGHRLAEARSRGQVMKSIEINAALALLVGAWLLQGPGSDLAHGFSEIIVNTIHKLDVTEIT